MYKYERGVKWNESYSNGYQPYWQPGNVGPYVNHPQIAGRSQVVKGEKWQRVECGYGYFMKPYDWVRILRDQWTQDVPFVPGNFTSPTYIPNGIYYGNYGLVLGQSVNVYNLNEQNYALALDLQVKEGIDIYRIVDSGIDNINIPTNFVIPTFARLECGQTSRCGPDGSTPAWKLIHQGSVPVKCTFYFGGSGVNYNDANGSGEIGYSNGQTVTIYPGGYFVSFNGGSFAYTGLDLPGNAGYDIINNRYTSTNWRFEANLRGRGTSASWWFAVNFGLPTAASGWGTWFVNTTGSGSAHGVFHRGRHRRSVDRDENLRAENLSTDKFFK